MAPLPDYVTGTITLTNGSPNFTGDGTGWLAAGFREGDTILGIEDNEGVVYVIESITDNDAGTLTQDWQGATGTYAYRMRYLSDGQRVTAQARQLIELLGNGNLQAVAGLPGTPQTLMMFTGPGAMVEVPRTDLVSGAAYDVQVDTLPDRAAYDGQTAGFTVLVSDVGDGRSAIYSKVSNTSGDWSSPAYVTGPVGPSPDFGIGTVDRGDVDVTVTPVTGGYNLNFTIPTQAAVGDYDGGTDYVTGDIVQNGGSSWVALQATTGNAPPSLPATSNTWWQLLARAGVDGAGTITMLAEGVGIDIDSNDPTVPVIGLADVPTATVKGRVASGTGASTDLTGAEVTTLLDVFKADTKGVVPGPTAGDITADRVLSADGSWVDLPEGRNYDLEVSQLALKIAIMDGNAWAYGGGPNGNGYADDLTSLDQIDVAGATNLDTSEAGVLKPTITDATTTLNNHSTGSLNSAQTIMDRTGALPNGVLVTQIGVYSTSAGTVHFKIAKENSATNFDFVVAESFAHPGGGFADATLAVPFLVPATGTYRIGAYASGNFGRTDPVARVYVAGNQAVATGVTMTSDTSAAIPMRYTYVVGVDNLTVSSNAFLADAPPTEIRLLALVEEVDSAVVDVDYVFEVSRDGSDWDVLNMDQVALNTPGRKLFWGVADVSGLDPGTSLKWRLSTTAVMVKLHDYVIHWRD